MIWLLVLSVAACVSLIGMCLGEIWFCKIQKQSETALMFEFKKGGL